MDSKQFWQKKLYLIPIALILILLIFTISLVVKISPTSYKLISKISKENQIPLDEKIIEVTNKILRFIDEINIFQSKADLLDGKNPIINLKFSQNDAKHFEEISNEGVKLGYLPNELNTWRDIELTYNGEKYKAKAKLHGDFSNHWAYSLKSYKIKLVDKSINNIRRFNLIIFEDRQLSGRISRILANEFNLFDIQDELVVIKINGVLQGIYYLQEHINKDFFEKNSCSNCNLIKTTDNYLIHHANNELHGITTGIEHGTEFDLEIANIETDSEIFTDKIYYEINGLLSAIKNEDIKKVKSYFDIKNLANFEAFRTLISGNHFIRGDNLRLGYSSSIGKFYLIPRAESINSLVLENGGYEHALNEKSPLFTLLAKDKEIQLLKNQILYNFVTTNQDILKEIKDQTNFYKKYALSYKTNLLSNFYTKYRLNKGIESLTYNFDLIKKHLEYSHVYVNILQSENKIKYTIIPDSISQIKLSKLILNLSNPYTGDISINYLNNTDFFYVKNSAKIDLSKYVNKYLFSAGLDENLYPKKRDFIITIKLRSKIKLINNDIKFTNVITNQDLTDININQANANSHYTVDSNFTEFKKNNPQLRLEMINDIITLKRGNYIINNDLIIPKFKQFIIQSGTKIQIAKDKSIISYSPLNIQGTKQNPIIITSINEPYGTFGVIGTGTEESIINWLDISNGSEKYIQGIYFSGGLSIHNMDVIMTNSKIHNHNADDGINIKYGNVIIDNNLFTQNFADQFDCDFCVGIIKNNKFIDNGKDFNGDGLDFSGSKIIVKNNLFQEFKDKGVSIGENTKIILFSNKFLNNNLGVAVKDKSNAYFILNTFENNHVTINSYQKKVIFGGATAYIYSNTFKNNDKFLLKDELSQNLIINYTKNNEKEIINAITNENLEDIFSYLEKFKILKNTTNSTKNAS